VVAAVAAALALAGCDASAKADAPASGSPGTPGGTSSASAAPHQLALVVAPSLAANSADLVVGVANGTLNSVTVASRGGHLLAGGLAADGHTWTSTELPAPGAAYTVIATATSATGATKRLTTRVQVAPLVGASTVGYDITPSSGWTVGVNAPVVIRFHSSVTDRASVERAITVTTSKPVVGSWHWISSRELHFRPQTTWPAHLRVRVAAALEGVRAGAKLLGRYDTTIDFATGDSHITTVNGKTHMFTVVVNGKVWANWPTSLGRPEFVTRSGSYIVLSKEPTRQMTSCHAKITCDPKNKNFYDLKVDWDARLTWSGTFIHSAPWSVAHQGVDNVSHGCINLSPARATAFYNLSRYGDLVTVTGTSRTAADLIAVQDPGMTDWNTSWTQWVAGSALGASITTGAI